LYFHGKNLTARRWLQNFVASFVERDLLQVLGHDIQPVLMHRFMRMLSHLHGQILNVADLARAVDVSSQTVNKYLNLLEGAFFTFRLEPFFVNVGKRLIKSPKFYYRDSGFYHAIARVNSLDDLLGSPYAGASWEGYVIEQVRRVGGSDWEYYFYRTHQGAEIDLVLVTPRGKLVAVEIKYSNAPTPTKGFHISTEDLKPDFKFVVTPESDTYTRSDGSKVCGLFNFLTVEMPPLAS